MHVKAIGWVAALGLLAAVGCGGSDEATKGDTAGATTSAGSGGGQGGSTAGSGGGATTGQGGGATTGAGGATAGSGGAGGAAPHIDHVFMILLENHNWSDIKGSASAPYLNDTLLAQGAHAEHYENPPGIHPSEPNYLWLEAGTNFGVLNDNSPASNHQSSDQHLVNLIEDANLTWKSYQEDISGTDCPLTGVKKYAPRHNPVVFFDDVTNTLDPQAPRCIAHVRPYGELADDLAADTVPNYAFITPNLCHDMHDSCAPTSDKIKQGDDWLKNEVPKILASKAFQSGVLIITWDESENGDYPIGMIVLSPFAKKGYSNSKHYTHSSTLRTVEEIFGLSPMLGDAANATDLADLFTTLPLP